MREAGFMVVKRGSRAVHSRLWFLGCLRRHRHGCLHRSHDQGLLSPSTRLRDSIHVFMCPSISSRGGAPLFCLRCDLHPLSLYKCTTFCAARSPLSPARRCLAKNSIILGGLSEK